MAHYVYYRADTDGDGYPEFIQDIQTMIITEDPMMAQQYTEADLRTIDAGFMGNYGFFPLGITQFGLRINPMRAYRPPYAGLLRLLTPPPRRMRPMGAPLGPIGPVPRPPRPPRPAAPMRTSAPAPRPSGPIGGPRGPHRGPGGMGPGGMGPGGMGPGRR